MGIDILKTIEVWENSNPPKRVRSSRQNAKLWPLLRDVSKQCYLNINGEVVKACEEDWKDVFSAALEGEQRVAVGLDNKYVYLGLRTSKLEKSDFADLIEIIYAFGSERNVKWSDPAIAAYEQYCEAINGRN